MKKLKVYTLHAIVVYCLGEEIYICRCWLEYAPFEEVLLLRFVKIRKDFLMFRKMKLFSDNDDCMDTPTF